MTHAIGQPVRLIKPWSVQAKGGIVLPAGASGQVVGVGDKVIVVRFHCFGEGENTVTFDTDYAADYMETDCTACIYFAPDDQCCLDRQQRGGVGA